MKTRIYKVINMETLVKSSNVGLSKGLTILPLTEWRQIGVPAGMEAQGQLGLQGQLLQFIGNSFALGAGGSRQGQEHWFIIIFASPSSVQPIHSNDGRGQAHHTGEIHFGFRDGNLENGGTH